MLWQEIFYLYNNVISVCISIGCWPWSINKWHTHTDRVKHVRLRQLTCFSIFMPQKSFNINHLNFYYRKQIDYIFPCVCVCTLIDHKWRHSAVQRTKRVWHETKLSGVTVVFYTLWVWRLLWSYNISVRKTFVYAIVYAIRNSIWIVYALVKKFMRIFQHFSFLRVIL